VIGDSACGCGLQMEKKDLAWERYYDLSAQELGALINMAKMGKQLHKSVPACFVASIISISILHFSHVQLLTKTEHHVRALSLSMVPVGGSPEPAWDCICCCSLLKINNGC